VIHLLDIANAGDKTNKRSLSQRRLRFKVGVGGGGDEKEVLRNKSFAIPL
jgi:hypothetical protein